MREAPVRRGVPGGGRGRGCSWRRLRVGRVCLVLLTVVAGGLLSARDSAAQDPTARLPSIPNSQSAFPKGTSILGPAPKIDRAQPIYIQSDDLIYDDQNNRVIAQGNVEIYYNNYILTADKVVYDRNLNKLLAEGNAQLKDPNGSITRADRFE